MAFNGRPPRAIPAGTEFGSWVVIREEARGDGKVRNRRFLCRCSACGTEEVKFLSNLSQGKGCVCSLDYLTLTAPGRAKIAAAAQALSQLTGEGRMCLTCDTWKPWADFHNAPLGPNGKASNCRDCSHAGLIRRTFGLTRAEWAGLHEAQGGVCALCEEPEVPGKRLAVDHDHACCGRDKGCKRCIRGLLCDVCNMVLGQVEARPELVGRFTDYLERRPFLSVPAGPAVPVLEDVGPASAEDAA